MPRRPLALAVLLVLALGSVGLVVWSQTAAGGADGRDDIDLTDRLDPASPTDEHLLWAIGVLNAEPVTATEVERRISAMFAEVLSPEEIVASLAEIVRPNGYRFEGVLERADGQVVIRLGDARGMTWFMVATQGVDDASRLDGLIIQPYEPPSRTHTLIQTVAAVAAAVLLFLTAARSLTTGDVRGTLLFATAGLFWLLQFAERSDNGSIVFGALLLPWVGLALAAVGMVDVAGPRRLRPRTLPFVATGLIAVVVAAIGWLTQLETADINLVDNPIATTTSTTAASALLDARAYGAIGLAIAFTALVLGRHLARPSALRTIGQPLVAAATAGALVIGVLALSWLLNDARPDLSPSLLASVALLAAPAGVLGSAAVDRWRLGQVAQLVVDIGEGAPNDSIEGSLRRALNDPDLRLVLWSEERAAFLDVDGFEMNPATIDVSMTKLDVDGRLLGAVLHHEDHRPDQIRAACSAVRLAIENLRLHAEVTNRLNEVRASRARLLTATDDARHQLERDLHDGAQQGMLAVLLEIQLARRRLLTDPSGADEALADATSQLETALAEVRDLARGLRPGALDRGLIPAIREIADRCPVPVQVEGPRTRIAPAIEQAAYYIVSEALTNVGRHAEASSVTVSLQVGDALVISISDDGNGRARIDAGGGLEGIFDRAAAFGGQVTIGAQPGEGSTITVAFPLPVTNGASS